MKKLYLNSLVLEFGKLSFLRLFIIIFLSLFVLTRFPQPKHVHAEIEVWESMDPGPGGTSVLSIAVNEQVPSTVYAGTYKGIYKSTNSGNLWVECTNNLITDFNTVPSVDAIAIHPTNTNTIYVGTGGGIFKSTDAGQSWSSSNNGLTSPYISTIVLDPQNPTIIFAGTRGNDGIGGIFRSSDNGQTWTAVNTGLPTPAFVYSIAIDPNDSNIIYASVFGTGIYKSINAGITWTALNTFTLTKFTNVLVIDPVTTTTIYVGTANNGVYKSTDSGISFTAINNGITGQLKIKTLYLADVATLYVGLEDGGLFKSNDAGLSWGPSNAGMHSSYINFISGVVNDPTILYTGTKGGVFKTLNGGSTWDDINEGLPGAKTEALILLQEPLTLYAGTDGGGFYNYQEDQWYPSSTGMANSWIRSLAYDPNTPTTLFAGTFFGGLYKSINGGLTWVEKNTGIPAYNDDVREIIINPNNPSTMYAGLQAGIYKSTDGGENWNKNSSGIPIGDENIGSLTMDIKNPEILYAGVLGHGVYKTTDSGQSWNLMTDGLSSFNYVHSLAVDPQDSSIVYAGSEGKLYRSNDSGITWAGTSLSHTAMSILFSPITENTIYVATEGWGVYKSVNSGVTWESMMPDSFSKGNTYVYDLEFDPNTERIYAAMNIGVFVKNEMQPTISLTQTVSPSSAKPGDAVNYTISFSNTSTVLAENISITNILSTNILNTSVSYSGTVPTLIDDWRYVWHMPTLAPNEEGTITITGVVAKPLAASTINNHVTLTATSITEVSDKILTIENVAPVANAGSDQSCFINKTVTLEGSAIDDNGDLFTYEWTQISGIPVVLDNSMSSHPTFIAPNIPGEIIFNLTVTDSFGNADPTPDEVIITIDNILNIYLPVTIR